MDFSNLYVNDVLLGSGLAAVFSLFLLISLPKIMGADVEPLSETPFYFYILGPILAAVTSVALQLVDNSSQLTIITWSIIAGIGSVATLTDFKDHRVPNILAYNQFILVIIALVANAFITGNFWALLWAGVALFGSALVTFLGVTLLKVGAGDLKYLPVIAGALGFINPWLAVAWTFTAWTLNLVFSMVLYMFHNVEKNGPRSNAKGPLIPPFYFALWTLAPLASVGLVAAL